MTPKIRPLHDRIAIKRLEEERTVGGIVIPDSASAEKPIKGTVVAVGNGKVLDNGEVRALDVKVGDIVVFGKYAGTEVKLCNGEEFLIMREDDVLAVVDCTCKK